MNPLYLGNIDFSNYFNALILVKLFNTSMKLNAFCPRDVLKTVVCAIYLCYIYECEYIGYIACGWDGNCSSGFNGYIELVKVSYGVKNKLNVFKSKKSLRDQ